MPFLSPNQQYQSIEGMNILTTFGTPIWNSWLRVVEADLRQLNVGLTSTWRKAAIHDDWRHIVDTALSLSLRFNGHFPGEPGLVGVC